MPKFPIRYINRDELKELWRVLERLQADVTSGVGWNWRQPEIDALVTVMGAVKDTYSNPPLRALFPNDPDLRQD